MDAVTIDAGIDLGTTNSAIAVLRGVQTEVIQHEGRDYIPSAVWIDRRGNTFVGERARGHLDSDRGNVATQFKRLMGSSRGFVFERSGKSLQPEELSAEVLKQLKAVYFERTSRDLSSAVVSVPAEFDLPQIEATKRAAQLAGIAVPALVQEPVAAALAYGFQLKPENEFWLVYDWGGGTFDVALVQIRDGAPRVIGHGGDTFLGGSDIDQKIVESILLPELGRDLAAKPLDGAQLNRLKIAAEAAKIRLSQANVAAGEAKLVLETGGDPVDFDFTLTRGALETLTEPLVLRTIEHCKRVLSGAHLKPSNIHRVILVGGPTMMPVVRKMLADDRVGLGLPVDTTVDPMTAVARGAAIFAGSRLLPATRVAITETTRRHYPVELVYQPVGESVEFQFAGRLSGREGQDFSGFTIEVRDDERGVPWRSGKASVTSEGQFILTLLGEEGRRVMFSLSAFEPSGNRVDIEPSRFPYTTGMIFAEIRLNHDLRIALKDGKAEVAVPRGLQIPEEGIKIKVRTRLVQATPVLKGSLEHWLRIPLLEGRSPLAGRNTHVGSLEFTGEHLQRDIPAGSDVELTVRVQNSSIEMVAYVPVVDQEFEARVEWKDQFREDSRETLKSEAKRVDLLLNDVRKQAQGAADSDANVELEGLLRDGMIQEIRAAFSVAGDDAETAQRCLAGLAQASQRLDEIESRLKWPVLLREAQDVIGDARRLANELGDDRDRSRFAALEGEMLRLMSPEYVDELRQKLSELYALRFSILNQQPSFLTERFQYFERRKADMTDQSLGERLIAHGRRAITENDMEALRSVNRQLSALVPWGGSEAESYGSTVLQQ